mgnify:FL=1
MRWQMVLSMFAGMFLSLFCTVIHAPFYAFALLIVGVWAIVASTQVHGGGK